MGCHIEGMTDKKVILGVVLIVSCLSLLGYLVHEKADGATVAAIATVTTLIAYFTQSRRDPPAGVTTFAAIFSVLVLSACSGLNSPIDPSDVADPELAAEAAYRKQQRDCIRQYKPNRDLIMACRAKVREDWLGETERDGGAQ